MLVLKNPRATPRLRVGEQVVIVVVYLDQRGGVHELDHGALAGSDVERRKLNLSLTIIEPQGTPHGEH